MLLLPRRHKVLKFVVGDKWFIAHAVFQMLALVCALASFVVIVLEVERADGSEHLDNSHAIVGLSIVIASVFQVLVAQFRPPRDPAGLASYTGDTDWTFRKQSLARRLFQVFHKVAGYIIIFVAVATVRSGVSRARDFEYISAAEGRNLVILSVVPVALMLLSVVVYRVAACVHYQRERRAEDDDFKGREKAGGGGRVTEMAHADRGDGAM